MANETLAITNHCPNLDDDNTVDLMAFWRRYQRGQNARDLFPAGGTCTRRATADLANYASNKSAAQSCRMRGDILAAQVYEMICDRIYTDLPDWARSW